MQPLQDDPLYDENEVAKILRVSLRTVQGWRYRGSDGPEFIRCGRLIRYRSSDLAAYLDRQRRISTSDPGPAEARR